LRERDDCVDRLRADRLMRCSQAAPGVNDLAARVVDAFRAWPRIGSQYRYLPYTAARWSDSVNAYTLPDLSRNVENISFHTDISDVRDPMTMLLSKVLNARCQSRKYNAGAQKLLFPSPEHIARFERIARTAAAAGSALAGGDSRHAPKTKKDDQRFLEAYRAFPVRRRQFKQIVLCSLLGNYHHVAGASRLVGEARSILYRLLGTSDDVSDAWFQSVVHGAPVLVEWCVREYIVHALLDSPGMRTALGSFMHFASFQRLTVGAMETIRTYVQQNIAHRWSSLGQQTAAATSTALQMCMCMHGYRNHKKGEARRPKSVCQYASVPWMVDMTLLLEPFHEALLKVAYRKPDVTMIGFLMGKSVRKRAPLVPRPLSADERDEHRCLEDTARALQREEVEQDEMRDSLHRIMGFQPDRNKANRRFDDIVGFAQRAKEQRSRARAEDASTAAYVFTFLTRAQFQALDYLVMGRGVDDIIELVSFFCPHLGVSDPEVVAFMRRLLCHHRDGTATRHERLRQLALLQRREPHAYNLLQVGAELIKSAKARRPYVVGRVSAETLQAQIEAAQRKSLRMLQHDILRYVSSNQKCVVKCDARAKRNPDAWALMAQQLRENGEHFQRLLEGMARDFAANPMIEETSVMLHYCAVCDEVNSNVQDTRPNHKRFYEWGLRSAELNQLTPTHGISGAPTVHCRNEKVSHVGACSEVPLQRINLLGVRVAFNRDVYQICVECAAIMANYTLTHICKLTPPAPTHKRAPVSI